MKANRDSYAYPTVVQAMLLTLVLIGLQVGMQLLLLPLMRGAGTRVSPTVLNIVVNTLTFGFVIFLGLRRSTLDIRESVSRFPRSAVFAGSVLLTIAGLQILISELDNLMRSLFPLPEELLRVFRTLISGDRLLPAAVLLLVVAPVTEETLFRGVFLNGFIRRYGAFDAVFLSALFFGVVHLNLWQFPGAFILGLYLAFLFVKTRSLSACIATHALSNAVPLLALRISGLEIPGFTGGGSGEIVFQPLWLDLLGAALLAAGLALTAGYLRSRKPT